jgi:hypothetical protein
MKIQAFQIAVFPRASFRLTAFPYDFDAAAHLSPHRAGSLRGHLQQAELRWKEHP